MHIAKSERAGGKTVTATPRLDALEQTDDFTRRHIGPSDAEIAEMLDALGLKSLDALVDRAVPKSIRSGTALDLPRGRTESDVLAELRALAARNRVLTSMIGLGYYGTITPPVIRRNVLESPGWYTAYTPYQPEISQGRLEALLNFQTMVADLTGMAIANASLLDEATAAAEAMALAHRAARNDGGAFFVDRDCHPQTLAVIETRARPLGIQIVVGDWQTDFAGGDCFGLLVHYPSSSGAIRDYRRLVEDAHAQGTIVAVATDLLALTLLAPPGEWGADVVVGSAQRFGVPMGFGGPHAGFMATREEFKRTMPGRLVGLSVDARGAPALRLALQTREQHIRRDKATSNICTAQVLLAVMAAMYAVYHGPDGLRTIASRVHRFAAILAEGLRRLGFALAHDAYFDTLAVSTPGQAVDIVARALARGINLRALDADHVGLAVDETTTRATAAAVLAAFAGRDDHGLDIAALDRAAVEALPPALRRQSAFLTHPVFNTHHSETEMLRYLRRLQEKDIALDRSMIPLGSCTMKLNATAEMEPVTWPEFADLHPFAPLDQAEGYLALIRDLESKLARLTGMAAVSLQPNAGSQGEYAGLLAIRRYHEARGEAGRTVCLIPSSAHGTNPASAVMAGLDVVVVDCDERGNVDIEDLRAKAEAHRARLAALMITYPSTHGVFEERIVDICDIVHAAGGQVYMDGANFNALVGLARPGAFGPDVMHLNLHKTFCIPHGGGGPGVGPIGVARHLAPYLPNHPLVAQAGPKTGLGAIAAAPWGSALILPISWAYIALMGRDGLKRASEVAILNANYIAKRLSPHYPVLYTGPGGLVAHECIIDLRAFKASAGVTVEDVAKRLMDYGFHAPTMSWPVAGTLMIEPTESEAKSEVDRFCDAMIAIRIEIRAIEAGVMDRERNPLKGAPHTMADLAADAWDRPYSRTVAAFPAPGQAAAKYWPPVNRVDNAYGDRHLVCSCPPLDSYKDAAE